MLWLARRLGCATEPVGTSPGRADGKLVEPAFRDGGEEGGGRLAPDDLQAGRKPGQAFGLALGGSPSLPFVDASAVKGTTVARVRRPSRAPNRPMTDAMVMGRGARHGA